MLLVTKKETLRSVEAKGAKFVEMSDLFAHELWCINLCRWTHQEFPKNFPKLRKDFLPYWEHKGNDRQERGMRVPGNQPARPNQGWHSGGARFYTAAHG